MEAPSTRRSSSVRTSIIRSITGTLCFSVAGLSPKIISTATSRPSDRAIDFMQVWTPVSKPELHKSTFELLARREDGLAEATSERAADPWRPSVGEAAMARITYLTTIDLGPGE